MRVTSLILSGLVYHHVSQLAQYAQLAAVDWCGYSSRVTHVVQFIITGCCSDSKWLGTATRDRWELVIATAPSTAARRKEVRDTDRTCLRTLRLRSGLV